MVYVVGDTFCCGFRNVKQKMKFTQESCCAQFLVERCVLSDRCDKNPDLIDDVLFGFLVCLVCLVFLGKAQETLLESSGEDA